MLQKISLGFFASLFLVVVAASQSKPIDPLFRSVTLLSSFVGKSDKPTWSSVRFQSSCFNLLALELGGGGVAEICYGNRFGDNWDIFSTGGSQSRAVDLGEYFGGRKLSVPDLEPWPALKPGETRMVTVNTSGEHGSDGANGGQKTPDRPAPVLPKTVSQQVTTTIARNGQLVRADNYSPFLQVFKDHMYLIRVFEEDQDYYILFRVDEVMRGDSVKLSFLKYGAALDL